jgi:hypothetical protein
MKQISPKGPAGSLAILLVLGLLTLTAGQVAAAPIDPFVGNYTGRSISTGEGGLLERDLAVTIEKVGKGFRLAWTTVSRRADGSLNRKAYRINFKPSVRKTIFSSSTRKNKFGRSVPLDPLKGEPYVWAKIEGKTLTVFAMLITDEGGYEMQVYQRTLTEQGLALSFSRFRDGRQLKAITGTLLRTAK